MQALLQAMVWIGGVKKHLLLYYPSLYSHAGARLCRHKHQPDISPRKHTCSQRGYNSDILLPKKERKCRVI